MNKSRRFVFRTEQIRELSLLVILIAVVAFFSSQLPIFFRATTYTRISDSVMIITVVAVGQTLVILTRNIDLSVGSVVGLTAYIVGAQFAANHALSPVLAIGLALSIGAIAGLINGLIIAYGRVPAIVATLGTLAIYRGILFAYANNGNISTAQLPDWLSSLPSQTLFSIGQINITIMVGLAILTVIVFQLALSYLPSGRRLYAIGSDPETAQSSGLPTRRLVLIAYVVCGMIAGLGGFMWLAKFGTITSVAAQGFELEVIAAAVLGGISTNGGVGRVVGALLGAALVGTVEYGLVLMPINEFGKDAAQGIMILLAVAVDTVLLARVRTWLSRMQQRPGASEAMLSDKVL